MKIASAFVLMLILSLRMGYSADKTNSPDDSPAAISSADQMKALRREADDAYGAYTKAIENRKADDEIGKLWQAYVSIDRANLPKVFMLAKQEPASEPAFESFAWIVTNQLTQGWMFDSNVLQTLEFLRDHHATNPNIAKICWRLGRNWDPTCQPAMDFLQVAAAMNPNREVRGQATLALGRLKKDYSQAIVIWKNWPPGDARQNEFMAVHLEKAKGESTEALAEQAKKLFNIVLDQYADCSTLLPTNQPQVKLTLGEVAKTELYELDHLTVGKVAPELEGDDINGNAFKLSDYRGKVVVLNFWASWCGPCMQMVPSEVRLAERMKGKSFAIVGVNGDSNRDDAKRVVQKENITWRSFWSKNGSKGTIPKTWNIPGWPTVFVLDPNGVIRFRFDGYGPSTENLLNQQVDRVLQQLPDRNRS